MTHDVSGRRTLPGLPSIANDALSEQRMMDALDDAIREFPADERERRIADALVRVAEDEEREDLLARAEKMPLDELKRRLA
jgi:hypothetical protein